jgi:hypothetical protein
VEQAIAPASSGGSRRPHWDSGLSERAVDLATELAKPLADPADRTTGWAGPDRLIWEGWIDARAKPEPAAAGLVFRLEVYVGERDSHGIGFSDNINEQYYIQAYPTDPVALFVHTGEQYLNTRDSKSAQELERLAGNGPQAEVQRPTSIDDPQPDRMGTWAFQVAGTGFQGTFRLAIDNDNH